MRRALPLLPPALALLAVALCVAPHGGADEAATEGLVNEPTRRAIQQGTRYLIRNQNADGSWTSDAGKKINERYDVFHNGENVPHVGVTSLAVLALLAGGHMPGRGPYGDNMDRAIDFILSQVQPSGYVAGNGTRMYSHAFATLALAEIYGVARRERIRSRLQDAIEFTVKCQNKTGGWRYVPFTEDSDMSVTVCQVVALRAARNVGIKVPRKTIERALRYVIESTITDGGSNDGGFLYQPREQRFNRGSFALCAAGLTTLFQAGLYDTKSLRNHIRVHKIDKSPQPSIKRSVKYMEDAYWSIWNRSGRNGPSHYFYYYGNYYAAQAMYQIGGKDPERWQRWYTRVRDHLLSSRMIHLTTGPGGAKEAYWTSNVDTTNTYATACALLILQFPLDHLPIHQR